MHRRDAGGPGEVGIGIISNKPSVLLCASAVKILILGVEETIITLLASQSAHRVIRLSAVWTTAPITNATVNMTRVRARTRDASN